MRPFVPPSMRGSEWLRPHARLHEHEVSEAAGLLCAPNAARQLCRRNSRLRRCCPCLCSAQPAGRGRAAAFVRPYPRCSWSPAAYPARSIALIRGRVDLRNRQRNDQYRRGAEGIAIGAEHGAAVAFDRLGQFPYFAAVDIAGFRSREAERAGGGFFPPRAPFLCLCHCSSIPPAKRGGPGGRRRVPTNGR